jgi:hypothetical protein
MNGIDLVRLKADAQVAENYMAKAIEHAPDDPTRAFAAIDDATKIMRRMYVALHWEHMQTIRRVYRP